MKRKHKPVHCTFTVTTADGHTFTVICCRDPKIIMAEMLANAKRLLEKE